MHIQRKSEAVAKYEYGCDLRRIYPWKETCDPMFWGSAIASVRPGECTTPHAHDEFETFIVLSGKGQMQIESEREVLSAGDIVFIPKDQRHQFQNLSKEEPLVFISIYWDSPEARAAIQSHIASQSVAARAGG
jgi:oxalate decarboxylase/phosphoglucose isomerase-like protein (cupin superfamily)